MTYVFECLDFVEKFLNLIIFAIFFDDGFKKLKVLLGLWFGLKFS